MTLLGLASLLQTACMSPSGPAPGHGRPRANVYRESDYLPGNLQRVAVLPLTVDAANANSEHGRDALQPVLMQELGKSARFEVLAVTAQRLKSLTGKEAWLASDTLPADFFQKVRQATGCDAVLFCHLAEYQPYPPVVIGWRMTLADASSARIWWAADELFDTRDGAVAKAACQYFKAHPDGLMPTGSPDSLLDRLIPPGTPQSLLASPRRFGQFTVSALVASVPER